MTTYFATIGFFDGVHLGHRYLIEQLRQAADAAEMLPMAVTFSRHPRETLGLDTPPLLTTSEERTALLRAVVGGVVVLNFTPQMARLTSREFMRDVLLPLGVRGLLVGFNHHFGSDRDTTFDQLYDYATALGVRVLRARPLQSGNVSSTRIRQAVSQGRIDEAARLLGRSYTLTGPVIHGQHIGRTLGFPTANIMPPANKLLPANGVYIGRVKDSANATLKKEERGAVINIGTRPTIDTLGQRTIEAHLPGFSGNLYGHMLTLSFDHRLRDERQFPELAGLKAQIEADTVACLDFYSTKR